MLLLLLTLLLPHADARCREKRSSDDLLQLSRFAIEELAHDRKSAYYRANAEAGAWIPCLADVVQPRAAAAWYQLQGIQAFQDRRPQDMDTYFQIARYLDPELTLDERVAPAGGPLDIAWTNAILAPPFGSADLEGRIKGDLYVDGLETLSMPAARPFIAQLVATNGLPERTWFVTDLAEAPEALTGRQNIVWSRRLGLGTIGAATLAAGLWVATTTSHARYSSIAEEIPESAARATGAQRDSFEGAVWSTNGLGFGAQVATGLALGLGVATVVVRY